MDPTKKVMPSAAALTACTYAGIAPRAKQEAPSMNSQAMAELRRAGSTRTLKPGAGTPPRIDPGPPDLRRKVSVCSAWLLVVTSSGYHAPPASSVLG